MLKYHKNIIKWKLEKYDTTPLFYNKFQILLLMENAKTHLVSVFKDYLIYDDTSEFIKEYYYKKHIYPRLKTIYEFYESSSYLFPNYTVISEGKYIYKNIIKKQKLIDYLEDLEEKKQVQEQKKLIKSTNAKQTNNNSSNNIEVFDPKVYENIITETAVNNSKINELFCVGENQGSHDSLSSLIQLTKEIHCRTERSENNTDKIYVSKLLNKKKVNKPNLNININNGNDCKLDREKNNTCTNLNPTIFTKNNNKAKFKNNKSKEILINIANNIKNNCIIDSPRKNIAKINKKKHINTKQTDNKIIINYNNQNINNCYIENNIINTNSISNNQKINGNDYYVKSVSIINNISKRNQPTNERNKVLKNNKPIKKEFHSKILSMFNPNINFGPNMSKKLNNPLKSCSNDKNLQNNSVSRGVISSREMQIKKNARKGFLVMKKNLFSFSKKKDKNYYNKSINRQILKNINLTNSNRNNKDNSLFNSKKTQFNKTSSGRVNHTQTNSYNFSSMGLSVENINSIIQFKRNNKKKPSGVFTVNNIEISSRKNSKDKNQVIDINCSTTKRLTPRESKEIFRKKLQHIKNKKSAVISTIVMSISSKKKTNKFNTSNNFINRSSNNGKDISKNIHSNKKKVYSIQIANPNDKNG